MHYSDKMEAKVKICYALEEKGWKIYGYSPDQSDSMTDYFHPASWDGIASKDGYILIIDNHNTYYSGYQVKKYNYNSKKVVANDRIKKLTAMMNDPASTENEKASCAVLIQKEQEKAGVEPEYTIIDTYPTFTHGNPKNSCWHIEKDGQIIAKGNGAFAVNSYDWEDKTKTKEEQKADKLAAFINRIEKVLKDADALQAEVVKVPKTVTKPIEKADKTINVNDVLSFTYHGHYWIVLDVYTVGEQVRVTYELLGSEKRGYKRVNNSKRYYQPLARLQKEMNEGKVKVYTLQEVIEYQEKTVFKKTVRKQTSANVPVIQTAEVTNEETANDSVNKTDTYNNVNNEEQATKRQLWALHCATKLNTTSLVISKSKASELITKSKNGHDISSIVKAMLQGEKVTKEPENADGADTTQEAQYTAEELEAITDSVIDYTASIMINSKRPETEEEKAEFASQLGEYMSEYGYSVQQVLEYVRTDYTSYHLLLEALESLSVSQKSNNITKKEAQDQTVFISKIDKQIESNQKKLDNLSGDYLTNTWKRQQEEASRENKREQLRFDIALLEHMKEKATHNSMTKLEQALTVGSFREDMRVYRIQKYKSNHDVKYPEIIREYDKNNWYNLEVPKRQKRLSKANIENTYQLLDAIDEYNSIVLEIEKPVNPITQKIKRLESEVKIRRIDGYFPTPKTIVEQMIDLADIHDGEMILEPSAGNGNILDDIAAYIQDNSITADIQAIECNYSLREIVGLKGYNLVGDDFLEYARYNHYDKIIMNPPFEKNQDIKHVEHAYRCLKAGGRIVAIMSPHFTFANDSASVSFREWLDGRGYYEKLPEGSFKESGTNVNTVLVVIDKMEETTAQAI